jgi:hypothetical protein
MSSILLDPATQTIVLTVVLFVGAAWAAGRVALGMEG